jgi:hypothetical protein
MVHQVERIEMLQVCQPGPSIIPTPALPTAVAGGFAKAAVLNQSSGPRWSEGKATGVPRYCDLLVPGMLALPVGVR